MHSQFFLHTVASFLIFLFPSYLSLIWMIAELVSSTSTASGGPRKVTDIFMVHPSSKQWPNICLKELYNSHTKEKKMKKAYKFSELTLNHIADLPRTLSLAPDKQINHLYLKLYFHVTCHTYIQVSLPCSTWHDACLNLSQHYTRQTVSWILPHAELMYQTFNYLQGRPSQDITGHHRSISSVAYTRKAPRRQHFPNVEAFWVTFRQMHASHTWSQNRKHWTPAAKTGKHLLIRKQWTQLPIRTNQRKNDTLKNKGSSQGYLQINNYTWANLMKSNFSIAILRSLQFLQKLPSRYAFWRAFRAAYGLK